MGAGVVGGVDFFMSLAVEALEAVGTEVLLAAFHGEQALVRDRALGKIEQPGDLLLGEAFDLVEDDDFTATGREGDHRIGEQVEFFLRGECFNGVGPIIYDVQDRQITQWIHR